MIGGRIGRLCNFVDAKTYKEADDLMCDAQKEQDTEDVESTTYQSSVIDVSYQRFACFTLQYKEVGPDSTNDWNDSGEIFSVGSETQQSVFNFIRIEVDTQKTRIFRLSPLSGFEVRGKTSGRILHLNPNEDFNHLALPSSTWGSNTLLPSRVNRHLSVPQPFSQSIQRRSVDLQDDYTKVETRRRWKS